MPHKDQIQLPSWEMQKDVYIRYTEDMALHSKSKTDVVFLSMFYKIWNTQFLKVVIPKVRQARTVLFNAGGMYHSQVIARLAQCHLQL